MSGRSSRERGFILLPVILLIGLIATLAYLVTFDGALGSDAASSSLDLAEARLVAEAGLVHAEWVANQSGCSGYSMPATSFGPHLYEATFSATAGSPVEMTVVGTLESGARHSIRRVAQPVFDAGNPLTTILAPGSEGKDSFIEGASGHQDHNKGNDNNIRISSKSSSEDRGLLEFDLSSLPPGAKIESASLEIGLNSTSQDEVVEAHALTRAWVEDSVTWLTSDGSTNWTTAGGDFDPEVLATLRTDSVGIKSLDLTSVVKEWISGTRPNHGLILLGSTSVNGSDIQFASSDETNASNHPPRLRILYACECGTVCSGIAADQTLILTTNGTTTIEGISFARSDLVEFDPSVGASLFFEGSAEGLTPVISAVHVFDDGRFVFSVGGATSFAGISIEPDDLIEYDPASSSASLYFDGSLHFTDSGSGFSALHILTNGHLVFATDGGGSIAGIDYSELDLVEYDPDTGNASVYFDGDATTLSKRITSLHLLRNGSFVLSAEGTNTLGGLTFEDQDLVEYDPATDEASQYFRGASSFSSGDRKLRALHVLGEPGPFFADASLPVAHWKLDDDSGTVASDAVGGHDGSLQSGPTWSSDGAIGGALLMDGVNDHVLVPHDDALSLTSALSISAWINTDVSRTGRILSKERSGFNDAYWLAVQSDHLWFGVGGAFFSPTATLESNRWHHVVATYDSGTALVQIYIDGVQRLSQTTTAQILANSDPLYLGSNWQGSKAFFGRLDDVRLFDYALDPDEVLALAEAGTVEGGGALIDLEGGLLDEGLLDGGLGLLGGGGSEKSSGCGGTLIDRFESDRFDGTDGTLAWATDWTEINESDGATRGDVAIVDVDGPFQLQLRDNDGGGEGVEREADLSASSTATLRFSYRREDLDDSKDFVTVSVSRDGGKSWQVLDQFEGPANDAKYKSVAYDISDFISKNTRIRFLTSQDLGKNDQVYIDDVEIALSGCAK